MKEEGLKRNHTREFKLECCQQLATANKRPAQICREHSLSESVLLRWRREYEARGEAAFTEKQLSNTEALEAKIAELERFCGQLALENKVLKKTLEGSRSKNGTRHDRRIGNRASPDGAQQLVQAIFGESLLVLREEGI